MILGTAGHIDHGKTTLVERLTGIHTDRLKEEQVRGITIELGFAHLDLGDGVRLGVVDVPGHERFVRHMVAGAGGIDVVMMVIAADEGVMPQTREHLEICRLMGVEHGLVVLTRIDLVEDADWLALVEDDLHGELAGSFLEDAPVVRFSALQPATTADVRATLETVVAQARAARGPAGSRRELVPRLPVDRVFTVKGFGTVVTGTLLGGPLGVGDAVELVPGESPLQSKVRGLQSHGEEVERAEAGSRVAVNLAGLRHQEVHRGQVVAPPGRVQQTQCLDATVEILGHVAGGLADRAPVLLHTLTQQVSARVVVLEPGGLIAPGVRGARVQLRTEEPLAVVSGDRFVLRGFSSQGVAHHGRTIGGGRVLDASAPRFRRRHAERHLARLSALGSGDVERAVLARALDQGLGGVTVEALILQVPFEPPQTRRAFTTLLEGQRLRRMRGVGERAFAAEAFESAREALLAALSAHHTARPDEPGMDKEALRHGLASVAGGSPPQGRIFDALLEGLMAAGEVARQGEWVRLASFLPPQDDALDAAILASFGAAGLAGFAAEAVEPGLERSPEAVRAACRRLLEGGRLVRIKPDYLITADALEALRVSLAGFFTEHEALSLGELRDLTGLSRKHLIPLVEHLDKRSWTRRRGDERIAGAALVGVVGDS